MRLILPKLYAKAVKSNCHTGRECRYPEHGDVIQADAIPGFWVPAFPAGTTVWSLI
jgi:hypothetical protein